VGLDKVVDDIAGRVDKLDVLVITHRHADHLSAFGTASGGQTLEGLAPAVVLRPWMDDPKVPADADEPVRSFVGGLHLAQHFAGALEQAITETRAGVARDGQATSPGRRPDLLDFVVGQVANTSAISRLDRIAANTDGRYLCATATPLSLRHLPGVRISVLGPPTYHQLPALRREGKDYKDQYWLTQTGLLQNALAVAGLTSRRAKNLAREALEARDSDAVIGPARWLIARMQDRHEQTLERIVEGIDNALNNTSLILLVEVGTRKLLFPGDAQGESWSWALEYAPNRSRYRELLKNIDLYKVGHHGSRNATPKPLYELWTTQRRELVSLMSTLPGKHGAASRNSEVPRRTLVIALNRLSAALYRTDKLGNAVSLAVSADTRSRDAFAVATDQQ
jgi:hypothetical protein